VQRFCGEDRTCGQPEREGLLSTFLGGHDLPRITTPWELRDFLAETGEAELKKGSEKFAPDIGRWHHAPLSSN
jgi:hypothetical protein